MKEVKNILVPIDFSDNAQKIIESANYFAEKCKAQLHLVYVVQSLDNYSGFFVPHMPIIKFEEEMVQSAEHKMESYLATCPTAVSKVLSGDVAEEIVIYAENKAIDLIIMGTHGYKGIEKIMFGSIADKTVKSAPCPVMTINPYK